MSDVASVNPAEVLRLDSEGCDCILCRGQRAYRLDDYQQARAWARRFGLEYLRGQPRCHGWIAVLFARHSPGGYVLDRPRPVFASAANVVDFFRLLQIQEPDPKELKKLLEGFADLLSACGMLLAVGDGAATDVWLDHKGGPTEHWRQAIPGCGLMEFAGRGHRLPEGWSFLAHRRLS